MRREIEEIYVDVVCQLGYCDRAAIEHVERIRSTAGRVHSSSIPDLLVRTRRIGFAEACHAYTVTQDLVRQRIDRRLGRLAIGLGLVSEPDVMAVLAEQQREVRRAGRVRRLGHILIERGSLDVVGRDRLLLLQSRLEALGGADSGWTLGLGIGAEVTVTDPDPSGPEDMDTVRLEVGGVIDERNEEGLEAVLRHMVNSGARRIVLELAKVVSLGGGAASVVVSASVKHRSVGGDFRIAHASDEVRHALEAIIGAGSLRYYPTAREAAEAPHGSSS